MCRDTTHQAHCCFTNTWEPTSMCSNTGNWTYHFIFGFTGKKSLRPLPHLICPNVQGIFLPKLWPPPTSSLIKRILHKRILNAKPSKVSNRNTYELGGYFLCLCGGVDQVQEQWKTIRLRVYTFFFFSLFFKENTNKQIKHFFILSGKKNTL